MAFPTAPTDQETYNGYIYSATDGVWRKDVTSKDEMFPVGMSYIQFPGMYSPIDLGWPGTWENVSNQFAGDFFRAEGGNASAFGSGEQSDLIGNHTHSGYNRVDSSRFYTGTGNAPVVDGSGSRHPYSNPTDYGGIETRPVNQTIRIWKRTA